MQLRVRIPDAPFTTDTVCGWVLHDATARPVSEGEGCVGELPPSSRLELVLPASRVLLTRVALPKHSAQRVRQVLQFAVEDRITVEPERVHVALGPRLADGQHAVAVVDREWFHEWVGGFATAGRRPRSAVVETWLPPLEAQTWTVVWRGSDGFVRTDVWSGFALDTSSAESPPAMLHLALQQAAANGTAPTAVVVRAQDSALPDLDRWTDALNVRCEPGAPWSWKQFGGAAGFDLLQGDLAPQSQARELLPRLRPALVLAFLLLAVHVVGTVAHWALLARERSQLQAEMREIFRTAFPTAQAIVDPPLQMRRQVDTLRRAAGYTQAGDFGPLFAEAARAFEGQRQRVRRVSYSSGKLSVDVELGSRAEAEALARRLRDSGAVADLGAVQPTGAGVVARFAFSAKGGA